MKYAALALAIVLFLAVPVAAENKRVIKKIVTGKDGGIKFEDGSPVFGTQFTFDGNNVELGGPGMYANFRGTIFDLSDRPEGKRTITFAVVNSKNPPTYYIAMHLEKVGAAFYDQDHNLLDNATRRIETGGPFAEIELTFVAEESTTDRELLVEVICDKSLVAKTRCKPNDKTLIRLSKLSKRIVHLRVNDLKSGKTKDVPLGLPILGGKPGLAKYILIKVRL